MRHGAKGRINVWIAVRDTALPSATESSTNKQCVKKPVFPLK